MTTRAVGDKICVGEKVMKKLGKDPNKSIKYAHVQKRMIERNKQQEIRARQAAIFAQDAEDFKKIQAEMDAKGVITKKTRKGRFFFKNNRGFISLADPKVLAIALFAVPVATTIVVTSVDTVNKNNYAEFAQQEVKSIEDKLSAELKLDNFTLTGLKVSNSNDNKGKLLVLGTVTDENNNEVAAQYAFDIGTEMDARSLSYQMRGLYGEGNFVSSITDQSNHSVFISKQNERMDEWDALVGQINGYITSDNYLGNQVKYSQSHERGN